jgi:hypothetical protein
MPLCSPKRMTVTTSYPRTGYYSIASRLYAFLKPRNFYGKSAPAHVAYTYSPTAGGSQTSNMVGDLSDFGEVWYNKHSLANILFMAAVRKHNRIMMDSDIEPALLVHRQDGSVMKFREYQTGLYYFDATITNDTYPTVTDYSFVQTVKQNKSMFHRRKIEGANKARDLYVKRGRPSQQRFEYLLANHLINNCPITANDARRALLIYPQRKNDETRRTTCTDFHPHPSPAICTGTPQGYNPL